MKKRVLALLTVLVMLVGLLPTLAFAEETACAHENKAWDKTDPYDKHYQYCVDCKTQLTEPEEHTLNAAEDLCTVCGLAPCDHIPGYEFDYFRHYYYCKQCWTEFADWEFHNFDAETGKCKDCGMDSYGCSHANVSWIESSGRHSLYCSDCGRENDTSHEPVYEEDVCTVCGLKACTHENAFWGNDAEYHEYYCPDCHTALVEYGEHTPEENGCPNCGSNYCTHEDYYWGSACEYGEPKHFKVCGNCGFDLSYPESHADADADGICDICGTKCLHENLDWREYGDHCEIWCADCGEYVGGSQHWYASCETCTLKGPCGPECTYEDGSNVCTQCGRANDYPFHWEYDEKNHWKACDDCGLTIDGSYGNSGTHKKPHADNDGVVGCDDCGYGCAHEQIDWYIDQFYHEGWCAQCGQVVEGFALHSGEGDTCEICGAKPCPETHTPSTEGDPHLCADCGITVSCGFDGNGDCLCDMCGESCHFYLTGFNETQHRERCYMCGKATEWENHSDEDGDGWCDFCFYGCGHENLDRGWYISHFNHFNWCQDCGLLVDNIADHVDADGDMTCDKCGMENPHVWKAVAEVPATCTAEGVKAHYTCDSCEQLWLEKIEFTCNSLCMSTIVEKEDLVIPKTAHETELKNVKAATCTAKGYTGDEICKVCGVTVKAGSETAMLAHDYKDGVCTVCKAKDPLSVKVEAAEDVPEIKAEIPKEELLTKEDKEAIAQGTTVEIQLTVENADKTVAAEDKAEIEKAVEKINADSKPAQAGAATPETKVGMYLDIDLTKTVGEKETPITEAGVDIPISVEVPTGLQSTQENTNREFFVLRLHEGQVDKLEDLDDDPNTVTFKTDRFSTYVLAYTDTPAPASELPPTGDETNILVYGCLMAVSMLGVVCLALTGKKRYF